MLLLTVGVTMANNAVDALLNLLPDITWDTQEKRCTQTEGHQAHLFTGLKLMPMTPQQWYFMMEQMAQMGQVCLPATSQERKERKEREHFPQQGTWAQYGQAVQM